MTNKNAPQTHQPTIGPEADLLHDSSLDPAKAASTRTAAQDEQMLDQLMRDSGFDRLIFDLTFGSAHGSSFRSSRDSAPASDQHSEHYSSHDFERCPTQDPTNDPATRFATSPADDFSYDGMPSSLDGFTYDTASSPVGNFTTAAATDSVGNFTHDTATDPAGSFTYDTAVSLDLSAPDSIFDTAAPDEGLASFATSTSDSSASSSPIIPRPYNPFAQLGSTLLLDPFAPLLSGADHSQGSIDSGHPAHPGQPANSDEPTQPAMFDTLPTSPVTFLGAPPNPMAPHKIAPLATPRTTMRTHLAKTHTQPAFVRTSGLHPVPLSHTPLQAIPAHTPASTTPASPARPVPAPANVQPASTVPHTAANSSCHQHLFRRSFRRSDATLPPLNRAARSQATQSHRQAQRPRAVQSGQRVQRSQPASARQHTQRSQSACNLRSQSTSAFQPLSAQTLSLHAKPLRSSALPPLQSSSRPKPLLLRKHSVSLQQQPVRLEPISAVQRPVKTHIAVPLQNERLKTETPAAKQG